MAHFRGIVEGNRSEASRLGTAGSGLFTQANGWDFGIEVILRPDSKEDVGQIELTGGSNQSCHRFNLGTFNRGDVEPEKLSDWDVAAKLVRRVSDLINSPVVREAQNRVDEDEFLATDTHELARTRIVAALQHLEDAKSEFEAAWSKMVGRMDGEEVKNGEAA